MSRALLSASTGLPISLILEVLVPSCTATSRRWHPFEVYTGSRPASSCGVKRAQGLEAFADRLPDRLHPDDLHFLSKHLQGVPPQRTSGEETRASSGATNSEDPSETACPNDSLPDTGTDPGPARRTTAGFNRKQHNHHHSSSGSANVGASFSSSSSAAKHASDRSAGSSTASGTGCSGRADHSYDDKYDHLHNIIFEQPRPKSRDHAHAHVRVELYGYAPDGAEDPAGILSSRSAATNTSSSNNSNNSNGRGGATGSWRHAGPQGHRTSGSRSDVAGCGGGGGSGSRRHWDRSSALYGTDEDQEASEVNGGPRRRGSLRSSRHGHGHGWESEDEDEAGEDDWYYGGRPAQSVGRATSAGGRTGGGGYSGQQGGYNAKQQHSCGPGRSNPQQKHHHHHHQHHHRGAPAAASRAAPEEGSGSQRRSQASQQQQQQQQQKQQQQKQQRQQQQRQEKPQEKDQDRGRRSGRRGVAWFARRWPRHFVSYEEYAEFAARDEAERGGGSGKYYRSAFEDDRDWASQFWNEGVGAAGGSATGGSAQSHQQQQQQHSRAHFQSQYAEQFTAGWWQRFQAASAASAAGGAGHRASSGANNFNNAHQHYQHYQNPYGGFQYGSTQYGSQVSRHPPELRPHILALGLDPGASLDAAAVKAAFRTRAKETHPDLQHGKDAAGKAAAAERFKAVQQAYAALTRAVAAA